MKKKSIDNVTRTNECNLKLCDENLADFKVGCLDVERLFQLFEDGACVCHFVSIPRNCTNSTWYLRDTVRNAHRNRSCHLSRIKSVRSDLQQLWTRILLKWQRLKSSEACQSLGKWFQSVTMMGSSFILACSLAQLLRLLTLASFSYLPVELKGKFIKLR